MKSTKRGFSVMRFADFCIMMTPFASTVHPSGQESQDIREHFSDARH